MIPEFKSVEEIMTRFNQLKEEIELVMAGELTGDFAAWSRRMEFEIKCLRIASIRYFLFPCGMFPIVKRIAEIKRQR